MAIELDVPALEGGIPVRSKQDYLVFGAPALGEAEIQGVLDCLRRRWIGTGPKVHEFEQSFAAYRGASHGVAVNSCTAALHLALLGLGIGQGDEVITTPMTFCATVNAIIHAGATPVLADCDRQSQNLTAQSIEARLSPRTKAILVVHMAGRPCDMQPIMDLARRHGLKVVEDCAHAIETSYRGTAAGLIGDVGCFSFYVTKNLTCAEGGMLLTRDADLASRLKVLALHGMSKDAWKRFSDQGYRHYEVVSAGFKYNMTDIQAALGLAQLARVQEFRVRRMQIWQHYLDAFASLPCSLPEPPEAATEHAYHLFTPLLDLAELRVGRDRVLEALGAENIGVGVHYLPVTAHRFYRDRFGWRTADYPAATYIGQRTLSLPLSGDLNDGAVEDVVKAFRRVLTFYRKPVFALGRDLPRARPQPAAHRVPEASPSPVAQAGSEQPGR